MVAVALPEAGAVGRQELDPAAATWRSSRSTCAGRSGAAGSRARGRAARRPRASRAAPGRPRASSIGTLAVKSCSAQAIAKRALGSGRQSLRELAPVHPLERGVEPAPARHAVDVLRVRRSAAAAFSSSQPRSSSCSTSPQTRKRQVARSTSGTPPCVEDGPLLRHVLARRKPRRVEARFANLLLLARPEHAPTLTRWGRVATRALHPAARLR